MLKKFFAICVSVMVFTLTVASLSGCATPAPPVSKENQELKNAQNDFLKARALIDEGKSDEAQAILRESFKTSEKHGFKPGMALTMQWLGFIDLQKGQMKSGIEKLERALKLTNDLGDRVQTASLLNLLGKAYMDIKDHDRALQYYKQALGIDEQTGNILGRAITHNNIGKIYFAKGLYDKAMEQYMAALNILIGIGDTQRSSVVMNNINILEEKKKREETLAEQKRKKALLEKKMKKKSKKKKDDKKKAKKKKTVKKKKKKTAKKLSKKEKLKKLIKQKKR